MVCRRRQAKAAGTSAAACLKRPAKSLCVEESAASEPPLAEQQKRTSTGQQKRTQCACGKIAQLRNNDQWYCKSCLRKFHPEAATAALEKRAEHDAKRMRRMCNGAPDHQPCTSRGDYVDPLSKNYYCLPCLQIISPEKAQRIDALRRLRKDKTSTSQFSDGRSCY